MARVTALPCCTRRCYRIGHERFCARVARETRSWRARKVSQLFRVARAAAFWCRTQDVRAAVARETSSKRARTASQLSRVAGAAVDFVLDTRGPVLVSPEKQAQRARLANRPAVTLVTRFFFLPYSSPAIRHAITNARGLKLER